MVKQFFLSITVAMFVVVTSAVQAGIDPDLKCKEAKDKAAGLKAFTLMKAFGKNTKKPDPAKLEKNVSKAQSNFTKLFTKPESSGWCDTTGDVGGVELQVDECVEGLIRLIGGPASTTTTTGGSTSSTTTTTGSTTTTTICTPSSPSVSGCFEDPGDCTIRDTCTGLQWEKKNSSDGVPDTLNLHDVDNKYMWAGTCTIGGQLCQPNAAAAATCDVQDGGYGCTVCFEGEGTCDVGATTTIWDWINQLDVAEFAGHSDWRVPEVDELEAIWLDPCPQYPAPCIDSIFGRSGDFHWSRSRGSVDAWLVNLGSMFPHYVIFMSKDISSYVRAVRGTTASTTTTTSTTLP